MNLSVKIIYISIGIGFITFLTANEPLKEIQTDLKQLASVVSEGPVQKWMDYDSTKLKTWKQKKEKKGELFKTAYGQAIVGKTSGRGFFNARHSAYQIALMQAKNDVAKFIETKLSSSQLLTISQGNESDGNPPKMFVENQKDIALIEKAYILAGDKLDAKIREYRPNWDGTGKTEKERKAELEKIKIVQERKYQNKIQNSSRLYIQGLAPIFTAEGIEDGNYTVVVGLLWTPEMIQLGQAMVNKSMRVKLKKKRKKKPVKEQIANRLSKDPSFLALQEGVRVWSNEFGERTVVSFAAESRFGIPAVYKRKAKIKAQGRLASFVKSNLEANDMLDNAETLQNDVEGGSTAYDQGKLDVKIQESTSDVNLQGVDIIYEWRGIHPSTKQKMYVVALAWSPSSAKASETLSKHNQEVRRKSSGKRSKVNPSNKMGISDQSTTVSYEADLDDF